MKRQITILSLLVVVASIFFSCKKDETSVKARITGKWTVSKMEVTGYTAADFAGDPNKINGNLTHGATSDYMDFKSDDDDQVELSLKGNRTIGNYITVGDNFTMTFPEGIFYCTVNTFTTQNLQFTAKLDKTNVVKVFYLKR